MPDLAPTDPSSHWLCAPALPPFPGADPDAEREALQQALNARERVLSAVAHDLRSPLSSLQVQLFMLDQAAQDRPGAQWLRRPVRDMVALCEHLSSLARDLLVIGEGGGSFAPGRLELTAIDPAALLEAGLRGMAPLLRMRSIESSLESAPGLPPVRGDAQRLQRVLGNLLDNAAKFTAPEGRITLRAEAIPGQVLFTVANSGAPVPPEDLERMFLPFWQGEPGDGRGSGLGLAICRAIVEAHGGRIWAEPAPGQRLRICFALPQA